MQLSLEPLATEAEASPGPPDRNTYQEREYDRQLQTFDPQDRELGFQESAREPGPVFEDATDDFTPDLPDFLE